MIAIHFYFLIHVSLNNCIHSFEKYSQNIFFDFHHKIFEKTKPLIDITELDLLDTNIMHLFTLPLPNFYWVVPFDIENLKLGK